MTVFRTHLVTRDVKNLGCPLSTFTHMSKVGEVDTV